MAYFPEKISIPQYEVLGNWELAERVVKDPKNLGDFFLHKKISEAATMAVKAKGVPKQILLGQRKNHVSRHPEIETYHMILNLNMEKTSVLSIKFSHRLNDEERNALCDVAETLIRDRHTFIFYPQQSSWIFLTNSAWTKGVDGAMNELFKLNPAKGSTALNPKAFRRLSSICLSPTGFISGLEGFKGIYITKEDVMKFYDGDEEKAKRFMAATDGFNPVSSHLMQAMAGRRLFKPLMGAKTWRMLINRFLPRPLDGWSGQLVQGEVKGNARVVPQLDGLCDYVVYEWNCTTEFIPNKLIELMRFSTIIHTVRTRWCWQSVMNMGAWGLYALSVRRRGESVKDIIANGAASIRNEFRIICEAYNEDVLDDLQDDYVPDDEDEELDSYGDVVSIYKKIEDPLEFTDIRSKTVNMLFNGPAYKYKAQTFSIGIPDNWAMLAYCCPDISGFNQFGLIDFDKCQLKSGEAYYAGKTGPGLAMRRPNVSAWDTIGLRKGQDFNLAKCDFYAEDDQTVYFNVFDVHVWMPQAGGADFDDSFVIFFNELVVNRLKKNAWFPPKSTLPESFKDSFMEIPPPDSTKPHSWKRFGLEVLQSFRDNTLPGIGLYSYCLGCLHLLMRYGPRMLRDGTSFRRRALPWTDEVIKKYPKPEDRWEYFTIDADWKFLGKDANGKKIFKSTREIITEVLKKKDVFLWAIEHIEAVIDAANGKPKYQPDPEHPGHYLPTLSAHKLVSYLSSMFRKYPGPNGRYLKNWIRIHTFMDDAVSGVGGCEYKSSEGKKNDPMFFGVWDGGRLIPAVLTRSTSFTSKKQDALKKTGLIWHARTKGGSNKSFIDGEFTAFMKEIESNKQWDSFFEAYWDLVYNNAEFQRWEESEPWHYSYVGEPGSNWLYNMLSGERTKNMEPEAKLEEYTRQSMVEGAYHIEKRMKQYALLKLFRNRTPRRTISVRPDPEMRKKVHHLLITWFITNSKDTILRKKNDDKWKPNETFNEYDKLVEVLPSHNIMDVYSPSERIGWMGNLVLYDEKGNRQVIEITKHFIAWLIKKERQSME